MEVGGEGPSFRHSRVGGNPKGEERYEKPYSLSFG